MVESGGLVGVVAEPVALAAAIRHAILSVPGVVDMSPGRGFVEATYGPGITVHGVGMGVYDGKLEVSVHVVAGPTPLHPLARRVREVVATIIGQEIGRTAHTINVYIDDIVPNAAAGGEVTKR